MLTAEQIARALLDGARSSGVSNVVVQTADVMAVCSALLGEPYGDGSEAVGDGAGQPGIGVAVEGVAGTSDEIEGGGQG